MILVAVTLVIAIAIVGWLMGLWPSMAGGTPNIKVTNIRMFNNGTLYVYIKNEGSGSDKFLKAELIVGGVSVATANSIELENTSAESNVIPAGYSGWGKIDFGLGMDLDAGSKVQVRLYFDTSGIMIYDAVILG